VEVSTDDCMKVAVIESVPPVEPRPATPPA
jgi:hypothetical protein